MRSLCNKARTVPKPPLPLPMTGLSVFEASKKPNKTNEPKDNIRLCIDQPTETNQDAWSDEEYNNQSHTSLNTQLIIED